MDFDFTKDRDSLTSVLAGGGVEFPISTNASGYMSVQYNLNYDSEDISPYDSPWVFRTGFGFNF